MSRPPDQRDLFAPQPDFDEEPAPAPAPERVPRREPRVYRVGEIVRLAGRALEARFAEVWVEGEVSNLKAPGHVYFTLKDADGQLPTVVFKNDAMRLRFQLRDGLQIRVRGRLTIYAEQGRFQLYADWLEPAGLGALQLAYEQLKQKLAAEGLFAGERKRRLPFLPRRIGVATSPTGAAVRDIVRVALRRGPVSILVAPCQVQGEGAAADIVRALRRLERQPGVDVIIVGRGGGSIEDLWAFNEEVVARAIAACRVPVISAVGHEVDYTIADFVADQRAATPSQAAELAVPVHDELVRRLDELGRRLERAGRRGVGEARQELDGVGGRAEAAVGRAIDGRRRVLGELGHRLRALHPRARVGRDRAALERLGARVERPVRERVARGRAELELLGRRLRAAMQQAIDRRHRAFDAAAGKLGALSPLRVLERGYALVRRAADGHVVTRAAEVAAGERLEVRLSDGVVRVVVTGDDE